jgi:plasmid stabilization system protein ParE
MARVRLTALAEFDLIEAQDFYAPNGGWVVDHFMKNIDKALSDLAETAGIHSQYYGHYRVGVPHFPFSIYYDIEGDSVIVKAILDDRFGPLRISAHFGPK